MKGYFVLTGTITYALQGRDILRKFGYYAELKRLPTGLDHVGCGYGISTQGDIAKIEAILRNSGVKILEIMAQN